MISLHYAYDYNNDFYTGTKIHPDLITLFIKKEEDTEFRFAHLEAYANMSGKELEGGFCGGFSRTFDGILRIVNAVKMIFKILLEKISLDLNAFKNLGRGLAETCPFSSYFIRLYDDKYKLKKTESKIIKKFKKLKDIAGVVIDGEFVFTMPLMQLTTIECKTPMTYFCMASNQLLCKYKKIDSSIGVKEIFIRFKKFMEKTELKLGMPLEKLNALRAC